MSVMNKRSKSESGQAMLEFAIVCISLTFMFAGAFTIGAYLTKALLVSNVTRSAAVLMVRSVTDTKADLNLALAQNQSIMVREASGLGLATGSNATGNSTVFLSKIVLVGANECAAGVTPIPSGVPPWSTSTCANYGSYVFAYYVAFGNTTRWSSVFGTPPASDRQLDGTYLASDIATDTSVQVPSATMTSVITLLPSQYALISETYADVSGISVFSIFKPPVIYYRTVT
jgi:Flp pilus assembly protein TadG